MASLMTADALYEKVAQTKVSLGLVLGSVGIVVVALLTALLQYWKIIDIIANLTEIWLFVIALPILTVSLTLIIRGLPASWLLTLRKRSQAESAKGISGVPRLLELVKSGGDMKVIGTDYSRWGEESRETMRNLVIQKDVRFTFLAPDPARIHECEQPGCPSNNCPSNLQRAIASELIDSASVTAIETALTKLHELRDSLQEKYPDKVRNVEIRLFDLPLTHSMAIAIPRAPNSENAEVHLWPYLHTVHGDQRPYKIYEKGNPKHRAKFAKSEDSYQYILKRSWIDRQRLARPSESIRPTDSRLRLAGGTSKSINFEARILEKKTSYHIGDTIRFRAKFTGELNDGGFTAKIVGPDGAINWWADEIGKRTLNGFGLHSREWEHKIPENYTSGKYGVAIIVYDNRTGKQEIVEDPIEEDFTVEA
jgi:hypothetical protein